MQTASVSDHSSRLRSGRCDPTANWSRRNTLLGLTPRTFGSRRLPFGPIGIVQQIAGQPSRHGDLVCAGIHHMDLSNAGFSRRLALRLPRWDPAGSCLSTRPCSATGVDGVVFVCPQATITELEEPQSSCAGCDDGIPLTGCSCTTGRGLAAADRTPATFRRTILTPGTVRLARDRSRRFQGRVTTPCATMPAMPLPCAEVATRLDKAVRPEGIGRRRELEADCRVSRFRARLMDAKAAGGLTAGIPSARWVAETLRLGQKFIHLSGPRFGNSPFSRSTARSVQP